MIPGGAMFTNVLQTTSTTSINIFCPSTIIGPFTLNTEGVTYDYYDASTKFPIMSVEYNKTTGNFPGAEKIVRLNTSVITGINDKNFDATFTIFPNPAKDFVNVNLSNKNNETGKIEVINSLGAITQTIDLGNESAISKNISISDLATGVYMVKTTLGNRTSVRKLIVE